MFTRMVHGQLCQLDNDNTFVRRWRKLESNADPSAEMSENKHHAPGIMQHIGFHWLNATVDFLR